MITPVDLPQAAIIKIRNVDIALGIQYYATRGMKLSSGCQATITCTACYTRITGNSGDDICRYLYLTYPVIVCISYIQRIGISHNAIRIR